MIDQQLVPWLTLVIVFSGMLFIIIRFLSAGVQIIMLALGKPQPAVLQPTPHPATPPLPPNLIDMLTKLATKPAADAPAKPADAPAVKQTPVPQAGGPPPWYTLGLKDIGFHETGDNRGIETFIAQAHVGSLGDPWCAIWANAKLEQAGVTGTRSASSQSFVSSPDFVKTSPTLGCIVVFWRGSKASGLGHVGFYVSETATSINVLGGNESDAVKIEPLPKSSASFGVVGYYWPKSVPLPSSGGAVLAPASSLSHVANVAVPSLASGGTVTGKMSIFGGPKDTGVAASEGVALCEPSEIGKFDGLFLSEQPPGTTGLARRLNPASNYLAMRWDYKTTPRTFLQGVSVTVSANGKTASARPIDWGPNERTGRIADLSPGLAAALGLSTDDVCDIMIPIPGSAPAAPKVT